MNDAPVSGLDDNSAPFLIGDFEVDPATHCIVRGDVTTRLEPRSMALLLYLAQRPGNVVNREELEREVWQGTVVGYDALNNTIAKLRKAFDDDPRDPRFIHTVPKKGYQLIAEVRVSPATAESYARGDQNARQHPSLERKLSAILYADVADYSRLTGLDEEGTHHRLSNCLDLMSALIERYHGSVVHFAGDAILADFATVSNALGCAIVMQQELTRQNSEFESDRKLLFRIGVNLGEVIVDRNDIYGDGVNVAARLEALAEPGGVCISGSVFDAIGNQLPLDYSFLGERQVKNIDKPVRAYQARPKAGAVLEPPRTSLRTTRRSTSRNTKPWIAWATVLILILAASLTWFAKQDSEADHAYIPPVDAKPSVGVLQFENVSDDPAQEFYAAGITRDLVTDLSKLSGLTVFGPSVVRPPNEESESLQQVVRKLRLSHLVEGSVRRFDGNIRINVSLVDLATSSTVWSEKYDGDESQLFDLHSRVIDNIVTTLSVELTDEEQQRIAQPPTENLEAYDLYLRAERRRLSKRNKGDWVVDIRKAMELYRKAIELDPEFAEAYVGLAIIGLWVWSEYETDIMPGIVAKKLAYDSAGKVKQLDPFNPLPFTVLASLQGIEGLHELALQSSEQAIELGPNNAGAWITRAEVLIYAGEHEAALEAISRALELNPRPPEHFYGWLAHVQYLTGKYEAAMISLEKVYWFTQTRVMTYGQLGRVDEAAALRLRMPSFVNLGWYRARYSHYKRERDVEHMLDGLRLAGIPENAFGFEGRDEDRLGFEALHEITVGRSWSGVDSSGLDFTQQTSDDGRIAFKNPSSLMVGTYRVESEMLCVNFPSNILGRDDCGAVYRNQNGTPEQQNEYVWAATGAIYYFSVDE